MIIVYTLKGCGHCVEVKEFLIENKINFEEIDARCDKATTFLNSIKAEYLPIIRFEGDTWIEGPEIEHIKEKLNIN